MGAAIGGVVHTHHDFSREQMLNPQVPLVNLGVPNGAGVEVADITVSPLCQLAVLSSLRQCQARRERVAQARILALEIVFGE